MSETTARTRLNLFARCEVVQSDSPLFSSDKRSSISADLPRDEIARAFLAVQSSRPADFRSLGPS